MKACFVIVFSSILLIAACGDLSTSNPDAGFYEDADFTPPDFWDPGDKPSPCTEGYSDGCAGSVISCEDDPCIHGTCIEAQQGTDSCLCHQGYSGQLCDSCADGYMSQGLICVPAQDPCKDAPCLYGTCRAQGDDFICDCQQGYSGKLCDRCAQGYHPVELHCEPD